mmetsp:Transcript_65727/g.183005  ORF Transcript_65727/g.183005 Transcript_65727/m.183005 type:complete len:226 (-) Transcript_65727:157-834(-)
MGRDDETEPSAEVAGLVSRLCAMRDELAEMQRKREALHAQLARAGRLDECLTDFLEILSSSDAEFDAEDQENLRSFAEAILADPGMRSKLPLPLVISRLSLALLPADEQPGGSPLAFELTPLELAALLADGEHVTAELCATLLASAQGRALDTEKALMVAMQRPSLLSALLESGRVSVSEGSFGESHLTVLAESSIEAKRAVLNQPQCLMAFSEGSLRRLVAPQA